MAQERKGASYRIKSTRPAHNHDEHTQVTQATAWANQVGESDSHHRPYPGGPLEPVSNEEYTKRRSLFKERGW